MLTSVIPPGTALLDALRQSWPPFVLVGGLLLIGAVAYADGCFAAAGAAIGRLPGGRVVCASALVLLVALVTAFLNLDTSVVFCTPVVLHAARRRGLDPVAAAYGTVFLSNSASLILPGANLTNLLVVAREPVSGAHFAATLFRPWLAAILVTVVVVAAWRARSGRPDEALEPETARWHAGAGVVGIVAAAVLVLLLAAPALPVAALGLGLCAWQSRTGRLDWREAAAALGIGTLGAIFGVAVILGTLAREWSGPASFLATAGQATTAAVAGGLAVVVNNLPAAVLLTARAPRHPAAVLLGLNLGPNLAMTGSLAAVLWARVARANGVRVSWRTYSLVGLLIAPLSIGLGLLALR